MIITDTSHYDDEIRALLAQAQFQMNWGTKADLTLLAIEAGQVIGLVSTWKKEIHPYRSYVALFVRPKWRRQGVGKALFEKLRQCSDLKNFQVFLRSNQAASAAFLQAQGFRVARKCWTVCVSQEELKKVNLPSVHLLRLSESSTVQKQGALALLFENYRITHEAINALNSEISLSDFEKIILPELNERHSFLLIRSGEVQAYLFSYSSPQSQAIEVGYVGGRNSDNASDYRSFYQAALKTCFADFKRLFLEIDDVDPFAMQLFSLFELAPESSYDTYLLDATV